MISFSNETAHVLPLNKMKKELTRWLPDIAKSYHKELGDIRIGFLKPSSIRKLKKTFFGHDELTDVLTFPDSDKHLSGDVGICLQEVYRDAKSDGVEKSYYLAEVFLHAFLHLAGLEHDYKKSSLEKVHALHQKWFKRLAIRCDLFKIQIK